ncbi:MAG: PAS domain S-box protein [Bacteroidota bacterium]
MADSIFKARKSISSVEYIFFKEFQRISEIITWFDVQGYLRTYFTGKNDTVQSQLQQLIGLPLDKIFPATLASKIKDLIVNTDRKDSSDKLIVEIPVDTHPCIFEIRTIPDRNTNHIMVIFLDITEDARAKQLVSFHKTLHATISRISKDFILVSSQDLNRQINSGLAEIGDLMHVDRSYIFMLSMNDTVMDNTHEWCAHGIDPQIENLQGIPAEILPWWMGKMKRFENIALRSLDELPPEAVAEREILEPQMIKSLAVVPLIYASRLVGFIGFDAVKEERTFIDETMDLLRLLGDSIINAIERFRQDKQLLESENLFHSVVESVPVMMWMTDQSQKFNFFNKSWLDFTGHSFAQECEDGWFGSIQLGDKENFEQVFHSCFEARRPMNIQIRLLRYDGSYRWIQINAVPKYSPTNEFFGFIGSCSDISEPKEIEYKYRLLSERIEFATVLNDTLEHTSSSADLLHRYLELTLNLFSFDGGGIYLIDREKNSGVLHTSINLPEEFIKEVSVIPLTAEPYTTVLIKGQPIYSETTKGKKFGFTSAAIIPFFVGKSVGGSINIATKRYRPFTPDDRRILNSIAEEIGKAIYSQRIEESLRQNQRNVNALFNSINDFMFVLDEKGTILEVNKVVLERLGFSIEELRTMNVIELHVPERREEALRIVGEMIAGQTKYCPVPLISKSGHRIDVETSIALGTWNNKSVIIGVTRDITERKKTEQLLHQIEERNRALIESSPDAIAFFDKAGSLALVNFECMKLFGYGSNDEMLGLSALDLFTEDDRLTGKAVFDHIFEKKTLTDVSAALLKKDGKSFQSEIRCSALFDTNHGPEGIIVTIRDITERLRSEEDLRRSEEENKAIVDAVPDLMFRITRSGIFLDCRVTNKSDLYIPPEQFLGKNIKDILPPHISDQAIASMERSFISKSMELFEYSLPMADGLRYFEDRLIALSNNEALSIIRDITDRKRAELALHENEQRLKFAFEASNDGMYDWNIEESTLFLSQRWKEMIGIENDEVSDNLSEWKDRVHPLDVDETLKKVERHINGETESYASEHRMIRKDSSIIWTLDRGKIVERNAKGMPLRMIGTLSDITQRVESEQQIKKMSVAIEQSFAMIVITDQHGTIQYVNPHFSEVTGYSQGELLGKNMRVMKSGQTSPELYSDMWKTITEGIVWQGEVINRKKNGEIYIEYDIISPIKNSLGFIENFIAIKQDITERRKNEAALEWNASLLQMMATSSPLGFLVVDNRDDRILYFNRRFCELWGITHLEEKMRTGAMKNNDIIPYCIPILEDPAAFAETCVPLQDPSNTAVLEDEIQFKSNSTIRRFSTQIVGEHGQYFGRFYIFEDITTQKQAEQLLKEREQLTTQRLTLAEGRIKDMSFYLDQASDAIVVTDLDESIVYTNDSVEQLYGYSKDELNSKALSGFFFNVSSGQNESFEMIKSGMNWEQDQEHKTKSKGNIWVHIRATIITDDSTGTRSVLYVISDITKSRQMQDQASHSQRLESIGTLASGIAHDMNNILGPILISLSYFDRVLMDDKSREINKMLKSNILRGSDLIKQILGFSRVNQQDTMVVQMKHIIRELERLINETFPKMIRAEFFPSRELFPILANPTQMHQVLLNLCVNARDAMPAGGRLEIRADNVILDEMSTHINIDAKVGPYCRITVADSGIGIPSAIIKKIYDPFFTTKEVGKGTGLGLFNVAAIIKAHKGFIVLESEVGMGTTFQIFLPATTSANINSIIEKSGDFPSGNGETILLVDDEEVIRNISKATLEDYHYKVITASNGAEALGIYASNKSEIKVVILDVMMPHMDGPSTVRAIRTMNENPHIIMMSGIHANVKVMDELGLPRENFITKPFMIDTLLKLMHQLLQP